MKRRMVINDLSANKPVSAATCLFMALTAMLLGLSVLLFAGLADSIDSLMREAKTPDFLQMHTGDPDEAALNTFSQKRNDIEAMQVCIFLNLQNSQLTLADQSLENNMQDNGLCRQSELFDYLVDSEYRVIHPEDGQVYVPVCYKSEYGVKAGDAMKIGEEELTVAGFLRDSQMNSMMASSKRFLVSERDYQRLRPLGKEEYLIEFRLRKGSDVNAFAAAYKDAGLPDNGPAITYPLIRMMNALSDGMMILLILLVSLLVLLISVLCIRYIILTQLEKDRREIGMLKAVGFSRQGIGKLYFSKYLLLSAAGCIAGIAAAVIISRPLSNRMRELYGDPGNPGLICGLMVTGAVAAEGLILITVYRTLRRTDKMSATEALSDRGRFGRRRNLWLAAAIITAAAMFMLLVPRNVKNTIEAPEFITYMGIGESRIRIDIRQTGKTEARAGNAEETAGNTKARAGNAEETAGNTEARAGNVKDRQGIIKERTENTEARADAVVRELAADKRVSDYALMQTGSYKAVLPGGNTYNLMIEHGDHSRFPVRYIEGTYPEREGDIALSVLNAREMNVKTGDTIVIYKTRKDGGRAKESHTVCGIYSDITNGGKTAKAFIRDPDDRTPVMWSVIYLSLAGKQDERNWVKEYQSRYSTSEDGVRVTLISDYLRGTYGQTIRNISYASAVSAAMACLVLFVVVLLIIRLIIWRERKDSSFKKALGFRSSDIRKDYLKKMMMYILPGMAAGIFAGIVPGQSIAAMLLRSMGAYGFRFIIDPTDVLVAAPALILVSVNAAALIGLKEVNNIAAYECLGQDL